jgi:hypothetical protein
VCVCLFLGLPVYLFCIPRPLHFPSFKEAGKRRVIDPSCTSSRKRSTRGDKMGEMKTKLMCTCACGSVCVGGGEARKGGRGGAAFCCQSSELSPARSFFSRAVFIAYLRRFFFFAVCDK